ncbi:glutamate 5-kinase [Desulfopila aestuarii]|uniref:Glutamate 5-kinase n=1 Tax=Desulfopila aestuarii DSM 18488 TaxID=1121416 RepID=A0A1M7Y3W9_9BACT|nr:glutamate 5-kinase [Desulfopila aestuarii]SHO46925.1 glutamate 5-kinase [Desulfopila aestuarii DSM 18488]
MTRQIDQEEGLYYRQTLFDKARRVVIKVGSAILTTEQGMNLEVIENLARDIVFLHNTGREVILVSSGAVAAGRKKIGYVPKGEVGMRDKQALAAIGQSVLMHIYDETFGRHNTKIAQVLLTHSDLSRRDRYLNVRNTLNTLFEFGVVPIINENDTVSIEELRFGDNDTLGALVANLIEADMFICLTDVVGLYNGNPHTDPDARPIYTVTEVTPEIEAMAGNVKSALGTGGMQSKIRAAKMVAEGGGCSFIGPGRMNNILQQLFSGEMVGTFFLPKTTRMPSRKHWISYVLKPKGRLVLDGGACVALTQKGKSLLPSGILEVHGTFGAGDAVECSDQTGCVIAVGLINYSSSDVGKIKGRKTGEIAAIIGFKDDDEVMHRDNLVLK